MPRHRQKRPGRHRTLTIGAVPNWVSTTSDYCMRSVAEDAYTAKAWADLHDASKRSCADVYAAGMKALAKLSDESLSTKERSAAGTRAARKFWEAKVCARGARSA